MSDHAPTAADLAHDLALIAATFLSRRLRLHPPASLGDVLLISDGGERDARIAAAIAGHAETFTWCAADGDLSLPAHAAAPRVLCPDTLMAGDVSLQSSWDTIIVVALAPPGSWLLEESAATLPRAVARGLRAGGLLLVSHPGMGGAQRHVAALVSRYVGTGAGVRPSPCAALVAALTSCVSDGCSSRETITCELVHMGADVTRAMNAPALTSTLALLEAVTRAPIEYLALNHPRAIPHVLNELGCLSLDNVGGSSHGVPAGVPKRFIIHTPLQFVQVVSSSSSSGGSGRSLILDSCVSSERTSGEAFFPLAGSGEARLAAPFVNVGLAQWHSERAAWLTPESGGGAMRLPSISPPRRGSFYELCDTDLEELIEALQPDVREYALAAPLGLGVLVDIMQDVWANDEGPGGGAHADTTDDNW